jgi:multiple sugar transport system permease protein
MGATVTITAARQQGRRSKGVPMAGRGFMIWGAMGSAVLFFAIWTFFPVLYAFFRSFYNWRPLLPDQQFVGLGNYAEALFKDSLFWKAMYNTVYFAVANVGIGTFVCLGFAILINSARRLSGFYRTVYFMPVMMSLIAASVVWGFIYQPRFGILNTILLFIAQFLHLPPPPEIGWLTDPKMAMNSIVLMNWWFLGYRMIILLAGLQAIPDTFYEAAQIDGAGRWAQFAHITMPLLRPTFLFVLVIGTINSLQVFGQMFVLTRGGPMNATLSLVYLLYNEAFGLARFGYAAAISFILFAIIMGLSFLQLTLGRSRWEY